MSFVPPFKGGPSERSSGEGGLADKAARKVSEFLWFGLVSDRFCHTRFVRFGLWMRG